MPSTRRPRRPRARETSAESPARLYSLSERQADWLRRARDTDGGAYVGLAGHDVPIELANGGAATYREIRRSGGTRSVHDSRPCEWTDLYLVPTELGLDLLSRFERAREPARDVPGPPPDDREVR